MPGTVTALRQRQPFNEITLGAIVLFLIAGGVWMYLAVERADLRYRLTYEVEADGAVRSGSGVRSLYFENTEKLPLPNTGGSAQETGEAVVIDLGGGRYVFSLMTGGSDLMLEAFADRRVPGESVIEFARKLAREKPAATLPFSKGPRLVTFTDINNPKTVKLADLVATSGAGVKLKRITVEITDDAVTKGEVEKVLGWWLETEAGPYKDPIVLRYPTKSPRGYDTLNVMDFWSLDSFEKIRR
jgi:hypothetical protein